MPLRDHFHGRLDDLYEWEAFHSAWANNIVLRLNAHLLPARYRSAPHIHLGATVEVDVATFEQEQGFAAESGNGGGVATAIWAPPRPVQTVATDLRAKMSLKCASMTVAAASGWSPRSNSSAPPTRTVQSIAARLPSSAPPTCKKACPLWSWTS